MDAEACKAAVYTFFFDVCNDRDKGRARELLSPSLVFHTSFGLEAEGPEAFLTYRQWLHQAIPDHHCEIMDVVAEEGAAAARVRYSGHHRGEIMGVPATGNYLVWNGAAFFRCAAGQILSVWFLSEIDGLKRSIDGLDDDGTAEAVPKSVEDMAQ